MIKIKINTKKQLKAILKNVTQDDINELPLFAVLTQEKLWILEFPNQMLYEDERGVIQDSIFLKHEFDKREKEIYDNEKLWQ